MNIIKVNNNDNVEMVNINENGFYYSAKFDRLFYGKIENDIFVKGYVVYFNPDEGNIDNIVYANFDKDLNISNIILDKDLEQKEKDNQTI